ncbi:MAG: RagB/SusD family nutrient uptake outer membrane protein [Bacteroidetes bacterium]|nr:RagB/SusD family nutrient uptake outer membrane protein [Bacteroidota bacterium]MBS1932753.1 RagB/SusD family nutrient uptake outer membrane protein [Bacteroidota bacterium]
MKLLLNKSLLAFLTVAVLLQSCSKSFIQKNPNDSIPTDQALSDASALQTALNGAYSALRSVSMYGRDFPVIGDLQADNTYVEKKNSGRYLAQYNYSVVVNDAVVGEMWPAAYTAILRVNQIIDSKLTGTQVDQIKAQAYAIRALVYFKLVNIYAKPYTVDSSALGVPLVLHYDPYNLPTRSSVGTIYNQIVSDLKTAFQNAPDYANSVNLSKYAIEGLLAKAYLYMGDNADAETAAVDVINNSGFSLVSPANYNAFWQDAGIKTDQVEVMFEVDADVLNNNGFDDLGGIYINGYQDIYCSSQLYNLYSATDIRQTLLIPGTTKSGSSAYLVNKFPNAQNPDRDNLKVIRLAEVYLIAAEAALPSNETTAKLYLNELMAQRDPSFAGYTSTGAQLLSDIVQERRKELAFEGDRLYDMNRLQLPINRAANAGAIPAGNGDVNLSVPFPDNRRVAPIPQTELQANPNIAGQQNPGY